MAIDFITKNPIVVPYFKSHQVIQAFEIKNIQYAIGHEAEHRVDEGEYYSLGFDKNNFEITHYYLIGLVSEAKVEVCINLNYFSKYKPRIGGYYVIDDEGDPSYLRGDDFRTYFHPHLPK